MSIVIVGGNECMECQYKNLCKKYNHNAKIFTTMNGSIKKKMGSPDLVVLFTNTVSHTMVKCALGSIKSQDVKVVRSHSSSIVALKNILDEHSLSAVQ